LNPANQKIIVSEPSYAWKSEVTSRIEELIRLEPGWDGYKGQPVSLENGHFALNILESIYADNVPAPQIVPGVNGDLQLEWHTPSVEIELHILAPYEVQVWVIDSENFPEGRELELSMDFTDIAHQLKNLKEHSSDCVSAA